MKRRRILFIFKSRSRGQTALETTFVFTAILFFAFFTINLAAAMHTKFIATYASFMASRSYQVYGDQTGAEAFQESLGDSEQELLSDLPALATVRTAEDIFTCALPWVRPPEEDILGSTSDDRQGCMSGERQYEKTNIDRQIAFLSFENPQDDGNAGSNFRRVEGGYAETERMESRIAVMRIRHKRSLVVNPFRVFDGKTSSGETTNDFERSRLWHRVYVPVILNPGLETGVSGREDSSSNIDESVSESDEQSPN